MPPDDIQFLCIAYQICREHGTYTEAMPLAICFGDYKLTNFHKKALKSYPRVK